MGTRHYQTVIDKDGTLRIAQYGQWDGYPSGQGKGILNYLKTGNLEKYHQELAKIKPITPEQSEMVDDDKKWNENYPYLSRDCGSRIHQMIENGDVKFAGMTSEDEAVKWCEGFYCIDFQKGVFTSEYHGETAEFSLDNLPTEEEYLSAMGEGEEEE